MGGHPMSAPFETQWPQERTDRLRELWTVSGLSASEIARELGEGMTRNGVLGKAHRMKLPPRLSKLQIQLGRERAARERARRDRRRAERAKAMMSRPDVGQRRGPKPEWPGGSVWDPLAGTSPIGIMDLTDATCRWPIGESPFRFCGCETAPGSSYCATHKAVSSGVFPTNNTGLIADSGRKQKPLAALGKPARGGRVETHELST